MQFISASFRILQGLFMAAPRSVQDLFGNGYGMLIALFVLLLAVGIVGLALWRVVSGVRARRRTVSSGRQAYERLSRRV